MKVPKLDQNELGMSQIMKHEWVFTGVLQMSSQGFDHMVDHYLELTLRKGPFFVTFWSKECATLRMSLPFSQHHIP